MSGDATTEYTLGQMSRIVGAPVTLLRSWLRRGLIRPSRRSRRLLWFGFSELTRAKQLHSLAAEGVSPRDLAAALSRADRAGAGEGDVVVAGREIAIRALDGSLSDPRGQILLDLYGEPEVSGRNIIQFDPHQQESFEDAISAEEDEDPSRAEQIYLSLLMRDGPSAEICFNLGNVLYQQERKLEAIQRYLQAVELETDYVEAWNNLGVALAEVGRVDESIEVFRRVLEMEPDFAEALYNLADSLEQIGDRSQARRFWEEYLRIDSDSVIADGVRSKLRRI